jgi:hypothetical protein
MTIQTINLCQLYREIRDVTLLLHVRHVVICFENPLYFYYQPYNRACY